MHVVFMAVVKYLTKTFLKEEGFILAHSLRALCIMAGEGRQKEHDAPAQRAP